MNYTRPGFYILILVIFGILIPVIAIDLVVTVLKRRPVGSYMNEFMVAYPWFSMLMALIVGAMVAHFFLNIADN
jgi:hypothetical protein